MKNILKKTLSVVLSLVLMLSIFAIIPSAASATIAVKTDKEKYFQDETMTATVYFPSEVNIIASLDMTLSYETTKLELVSVTSGKDLDAALKAQTNGKAFSESHKTPGKIVWSLAGTQNFNFKGTFATLVFTVKTRAMGGNSTLRLNVVNAVNSGYLSVKDSLDVQSATFEINKVAANELAFERTEDNNAYEVVGYPCVTVDNISIPSSYAGLPVIGINEEAFKNHAELKKIELPETLVYIGKGAFKGCSGVTKIEIPDTVETIGEEAFKGCTNLTDLTLPIGLETIEKETFAECSFLEKVEIPFTVKKLCAGAFENCYLLSTVKIAKGTNDIDATAFRGCYPNVTFNITEGNTFITEYIGENLPGARTKIIDDITDGTASCDERVESTGSPLKPKVTLRHNSGVRMVSGRDYKVVYKNNFGMGIATVYVAGLANYGEGYTLHFSIECFHRNTQKMIVVPATCTEDGYFNIVCSDCGHIERENISAFGHSEGAWMIDVYPTLFETGLKHSICTDCKETLESDVVLPKAFPDLNGDGFINSSDALIILQYATELKNYLTTDELLLNADTNGDGKINSSDALDVLLIAIGKLTIEGYEA